MRTINQMTNEQGLVKQVALKSRLNLWKTLKSSSQGFSLEVFRDHRHLASISTFSPDRATFETYFKGNLILEVNMGLRTVTMQGELHMADGWMRGYEIELLLHVSQPALFAQQYQQQSDPLALAQKEVERILEIRTMRATYQTVNVEQLRSIAELEFSRATIQRCGVTIDAVNHLTLAVDANRAEINQIRYDAYKTEIQDDLEAQRAGRRAEIQREQAERNNQFVRRERLRDAHAGGMVQRIERDYAEGYDPADILARYPQQLVTPGEPQVPALPGPVPEQTPILLPPPAQIKIREIRQPEVTEDVVHQLPPSATGAPDAPGGLTIRAHRPSTAPTQPVLPVNQPTGPIPQQLYNARLGLTLAQLSDEQRAGLSPQVSVCYVVEAVDPSGAAERGKIRPGDYLLTLNDQAILSEQSLQALLGAITPTATNTLRVLRDGQFYDLDLRI